MMEVLYHISRLLIEEVNGTTRADKGV